MKRYNYFKFLVILLILIFMTGCGTSNITTPSKPVINSFTADPLTITAGGSSTLSWEVSDATSISIDHEVGSSLALSSSASVFPTVTTTYTLTATNAAGTVTVTVKVTVSTTNYTVTFNSQGGSAVSSQMVEESGLVTEPTVPTKTGYAFSGWYKEPGCTNEWNFNTDMVTAFVTLYAKWTANAYTITFDKNDSAATGTMIVQTIASGLSENLTACAFSKKGYTFEGWAETSGGEVVYTDQASFTMGTANVTLYAQWTPLFAIGDIGPAEGLIFYVKEDGYGYTSDWMYLEAAPASTEWALTEWGSFQSLIGGTGTAIGTGQSNTTTIVNWLDSNTDDTYGDVTEKDNRAAYLCNELLLSVYRDFLIPFDDWFLPSKDELNLMYTNLKLAGLGDFADGYYWSSSEDNAYNAWLRDFYDGNKYGRNKNNNGRVRAVRSF